MDDCWLDDWRTGGKLEVGLAEGEGLEDSDVPPFVQRPFAQNWGIRGVVDLGGLISTKY